MAEMPKPGAGTRGMMPRPDGREPDGRFAAGNRIWEACSTAGRKPKFSDPDHLWNCCVEYFEWVADNPLHESKLVSFQGRSKLEKVPKMRAMTVTGMCVFLGITFETWSNWRKNRPEFSEIITRVEEIIRTQKFEGASAELLNPNIIARDLGLADKRDLSSEDGTMSPAPAQQYDWSRLTEDELQTVTELLEKAAIEG